MYEAALAAERAEFAALNALCAASPRAAADYAALLRRTPRGTKVKWLFNSALDNNATLMRLLLAAGLSPSTTDPEQGSLMPMHFAAQNGAIDALRVLLEAGADANSFDSWGNTPFQLAVFTGKLTRAHSSARELIPHTDLRILSATGNNVLHTSIVVNQPEIFRLLLPHFADNIDVRTIKGRPPGDPNGTYNSTPLLLACTGGYHAMVKALLAAGALRTAHDNNSVSCLHAAACFGHLACVTLLIGRPENLKMSPAEINARDSMWRTPLRIPGS